MCPEKMGIRKESWRKLKAPIFFFFLVRSVIFLNVFSTRGGREIIWVLKVFGWLWMIEYWKSVEIFIAFKHLPLENYLLVIRIRNLQHWWFILKKVHYLSSRCLQDAYNSCFTDKSINPLGHGLRCPCLPSGLGSTPLERLILTEDARGLGRNRRACCSRPQEAFGLTWFSVMWEKYVMTVHGWKWLVLLGSYVCVVVSSGTFDWSEDVRSGFWDGTDGYVKENVGILMDDTWFE